MIIELLRNRIKTCGKSQYQIAKESGVDKAAVNRILHGGSCKVETADRLFEYFGLEVVESKKDR